MTRRAVLGGLLLAGGLAALPRPARALGGTLPTLDAPAPDFDLPGSSSVEPDRTRWRLADFAGSWLVLYFYPKDFTGGCTLEARGFQASLEGFHSRGAEVVGVSADSAEQHESFCSSEALAFPLLSDSNGSVSRTYGSWIAPFSQRHTFLIDPEGRLRRIWTAVRPTGHAAEVLAVLTEMQASGSSVRTGTV
ncbi:peroxiredoxin [Synechococcus sp. RSCCF101]|uniref:peroxiredoxin n=1 Tax=Synechococcus sp. RSCCF101 TaxID=2511069 RepID=UPI001CD935DE|nr:peroxiredoxin [Synechococcus sp. RSCCF101]